jgi:signal transduction histidine kinase
VTAHEGSTRVPATHRAEETERALNLLIHDVRAPLSVAQGYLRLLHQNTLETEADRQRALAQSMEALGRIGRLCEDAAAFVAEPVPNDGPVSTVQVSDVVERLAKDCAERGSPLTFVPEPATLSGSVRIINLDRVVQSLAVILCAVRRSTRNPSVLVSVLEDAKEARFLLGCDEDRATLVSQSPEAFDPWRGGHGIALPLACRTVAVAAGGRIWTCANGRGAVGIALPEEASAP